MNDDPEYQWIDKIRTPRASNEARQRLFSKLSGEVKRKIGMKVMEMGGNAVIGYQQLFDLEGECTETRTLSENVPSPLKTDRKLIRKWIKGTSINRLRILAVSFLPREKGYNCPLSNTETIYFIYFPGFLKVGRIWLISTNDARGEEAIFLAEKTLIRSRFIDVP